MEIVLYRTACLLTLAVIVLTLCLDLTLYLTGRKTISQWLRLHPLWYWTPALLMLVFMAVLAVHLFLLPF